jgi:ribosomal protein S18 acetylase RimI-like enzyme
LTEFVRRSEFRDRSWLEEILRRSWSGAVAIVNGEPIELLDQHCLVAGERDGFAVFRLKPKPELLLLQSVKPSSGVGTALLKSLVAHLRDLGFRQLFVTTTNDNLDALRFYQRRGFEVCETRPSAVDRARLLKPSIPLVAANGMPIRDEIELKLNIEGA